MYACIVDGCCYIDNYSRGTRVKYSRKNFRGPLQNAKVWPSESFLVYGIYSTYMCMYM